VYVFLGMTESLLKAGLSGRGFYSFWLCFFREQGMCQVAQLRIFGFFYILSGSRLKKFPEIFSASVYPSAGWKIYLSFWPARMRAASRLCGDLFLA
jgi:hypothetical protein